MYVHILDKYEYSRVRIRIRIAPTMEKVPWSSVAPIGSSCYELAFFFESESRRAKVKIEGCDVTKENRYRYIFRSESDLERKFGRKSRFLSIEP